MTRQKNQHRTPWRLAVIVTILVLAICGFFWWFIQGMDIALFNPQGAVGKKERDLLVFTILLSLVVIIPVYIMLFVFAWRYRENNHKKTVYTPDVEGNKWMEAVWWGIPITIIGLLCVVTWVTTHDLDPQEKLQSDVPALKVQVVALQWKWLFLYPEQQIASVNELRVPAGTPINFELTADGPMSAFWVPSLGTQTYAMPGMSSKLSLIADGPGTYRGTNSNINGKGYSKMDFKVIALNTRQDFDAWAQSISSHAKHDHLGWDSYETLAKPSESNPVTYFHLHDTDLYTKIIDKYMGDNSHDVGSEEGHGH